MYQATTLEAVRYQIRRRICPSCVFRRGPDPPADARVVSRVCELGCPIFENLDELRECAICLDPMFSRERALGVSIRQIVANTASTDGPARTPLTQYAEEVARVVAATCND